MIIDADVFFARRLGYGLRQGEVLGASPRDWAVAQLSTIPPLDFYGSDGESIRHQFPDFVEPVTTMEEACRLHGVYQDVEEEMFAKAGEMDPSEWDRETEQRVWRPMQANPSWADCIVRSLTAINGPSPVFERFWSFWVNHFAVNAPFNIKLFYGPHTRAIRASMTGKFRDMLPRAILNPAMLFYLDNHLSTGPNSEMAKRSKETINENLAREVLELHTVSPAAGYTQEDVIQAAYALSGWRYFTGSKVEGIATGNPYGTWFMAERHEPGERTIMGRAYHGRNQGRNQAPQLLDDLAGDPLTAQHLSLKLLRHFLADDPPADSIKRVADIWMATDGDLLAVHTAVIDEVIAHGAEYQKFTTPENWLFQMHRTSDFPLPKGAIWTDQVWINALYSELGQGFDETPQPNGWSDLEADWTSKELLDRRLRYAYSTCSTYQRPAHYDHFLDYATRIAGPDSLLVQTIKSAPPLDAGLLLFASPDFMRI